MSVEETGVGAGADARREQILRAALEVIAGRGYADTRVADVAERAEVSPALVIYYFRTKDALLVEAFRYAEDRWSDTAARRIEASGTAAGRLEELVAMWCLPDPSGWVGPRPVRLDLWAQSSRNPGIGHIREESDQHRRRLIGRIVREGQRSGEFGALDGDDFALTFAALLDGLAAQLALESPVVGAWRAVGVVMRLAGQLLGFDWSGRPAPDGPAPAPPAVSR